MELTPRVQRRIESMFAEPDRATATTILTIECGEKLPVSDRFGGSGFERIQAAVLKLSEGSLDQLRRAAREAQIDWRDVLMAAGFGYDVNAHKAWLDHTREAR
jgi:hypothetical protein